MALSQSKPVVPSERSHSTSGFEESDLDFEGYDRGTVTAAVPLPKPKPTPRGHTKHQFDFDIRESEAGSEDSDSNAANSSSIALPPNPKPKRPFHTAGYRAIVAPCLQPRADI